MLLFLIWGALAFAASALGVALNRTTAVKRYLAAGIPSFLVGGFIGWLGAPTLNLQFGWIWMSSFTFVIFGAVIGHLLSSGRDRYEPLKGTGFLIKVIGTALLIFVAVAAISSWAVFNSSAYHNLIGQPKAAQAFSKDVAAVDTARLRVVGEPLAKQIMDKMLGDQSGLGSQVSLGDVTITQINGCFDFKIVGSTALQHECFAHELVWVAPMVHSDLFRWMSNGTTHQFAMVSASDPTRKFFVNEVNGHQFAFRYMTQGAYFGDNLERYLRSSGYIGTGLTDFSFELDDQGKPWWVASTFVKRIGFGGSDATGVLVIDPETGAVAQYGLNNVPAWVDRIQPAEFMLSQFDNWGAYVHGWLNSWISHLDMVQTSTDDLHLVEGLNGRTYWYTGVTSFGKDNSTTGFVLIDTKTKEVRLYRSPGATEEAAQGSAQNAPGVKEKQYQAGEPVLYNMDGHPTYFMVLSGSDNLPRMYAFVSVSNYEIVGVGDTVAGALRQYETKISATGRAGLGQSAIETKTSAGSVIAISRDGDSWGMVVRDASGKDTEYTVPGSASPEVKYTQVGNSVSMTYQVIDNRADRPVTTFDNLDLHLSDPSTAK